MATRGAQWQKEWTEYHIYDWTQRLERANRELIAAEGTCHWRQALQNVADCRRKLEYHLKRQKR